MSNEIVDKVKNYKKVKNLLEFHYSEVGGEEFYKYIFS